MRTTQSIRFAARLGATALLACGLSGAAMAQSCPDVGLGGAPLGYGAGQLQGGLSFDVIAGGNIDLGACGSAPGYGWIVEAPDFELTLSGAAADESLTLSVSGDCDTVLLVNDATGEWFFSDDEGGGLDPAISIAPARNGVYDIWVGTYGTETCPSVLTLQTGAGSGGAAASK
ncbi:peptidase S1 [Roseibacterium sp. SDUM158016]|jgi:hypothetical protein|uniref:peptidase S1 n=1 Tax=Roseicyclus sediminis TaxID=2980997 RepID=UPI0021D0E10F|nr:peptidase S1 [Roseibacterium sp. SDUM158016]MCU4654772.1 peptidase S1 [Roseibacterium sp. SDUM158016]